MDARGSAYVIGATRSTNFPTQAPLQPAFEGYVDAFVSKLDSTGSALVYSTYLGGFDFDEGLSIAVDGSGNAYVTGDTRGNFPLMNPLQSIRGGGTCQDGDFTSGCPDAFLAKLDSTGSALVYSTYLGGKGNDLGFGIAVDTSGNALVTGRTAATNFPTKNAFQPAFGGGSHDAFVAKLDPTGTALVYSTYLGGSGEDQGYAIAIDHDGNSKAYVTGKTASINFPTKNPLQPMLNVAFDAFVTKIGDYRLRVQVSGKGTVTSSPTGINCPGACVHDYPAGTMVTLTATPSSTWKFSHWKGGACSGTATTCTFTMNSNRVTAAIFTEKVIP